ncbi:hypothetical protein C475_09112 [Halosimplex carlsbadense 2-9-1]|uniref:DUF7282 domain-containing protein n=1 Tax=Halosimplex carlsbadense 2-9-1 TaxID=797114 RepID=M0CV90_9EURY|nr:hypothetical protein [Halosimplex carlsbadense]ELZ26337.1 hypothetical protein C475_09112 [Halosimplex carlsbadense 2-9-1]
MSGTASRRVAVVLALALALTTPLAVATVQAHGDHVAADSQVTDDGAVVVEAVSALRPGFVVLHADDGGRPGAPIGHEYVGRTPDLTYRTSVPVRIDDATWAEWPGNRTVWAVLHNDVDGDETFDPGTDASAARLSPAARTKITVRKSDGVTRVLGMRFEAQPVPDGALTVRRVDFSAPGHVAVYPVGRNASIGSRSLPAGVHRNVTVALNESFVAERDRDFRVRVVAHRDDGDGAFGPADPPITAGDRPVQTYLTVAPGNGTDDGPLINTPTVTTAPEASPTASPTDGSTAGSGTVTSAPAGTSPGGATGGEPAATETTSGSGAGFGVALAALVVVLATLVAVGRSRRE